MKRWKCFFVEFNKLNKSQIGSFGITAGLTRDTYQNPKYMFGIGVLLIKWAVGIGICFGKKAK